MNQIQIGIPDGSMQQKVERLFQNAGLPIQKGGDRVSEAFVDAQWVKQVIYQRPQELSTYLFRNHHDVALIGEDWAANCGLLGKFTVLATLPIGRGGNRPVRIVLAVPETSDVKRPEDLPRGCEIATEYVELAMAYFERMGRGDIQVIRSWGKTEQKPKLFGLTGVIEVTESGRSLRANGLKEVCLLMKSSLLIAANATSYQDSEKRRYIDSLAKRIYGAYQASLYVSLTANVPETKKDEAAETIGGMKGPNYSQNIGNGKGFCTLEATVLAEKEDGIILALQKIGVEDIKVVRDIPLIMS